MVAIEEHLTSLRVLRAAQTSSLLKRTRRGRVFHAKHFDRWRLGLWTVPRRWTSGQPAPEALSLSIVASHNARVSGSPGGCPPRPPRIRTCGTTASGSSGVGFATWFVRDVAPRLKGRASLIRFADDLVFVFARKDDAERVFEVLPKRFGKYGLTLHPDKTRLVPFKRPRLKKRRDEHRPGTFDFLGFTHYWGRSRNGNGVVMKRTAKDRFSRTLRRIRAFLPSRTRSCSVAMVLEAVYEESFYDFSFGFRPRRSAHQACEALWKATMQMTGGWVLEVDIKKFFDTLDHGQLRTILHQRVRDGVILRLIGKWLNAGVMEGLELSHPESGDWCRMHRHDDIETQHRGLECVEVRRHTAPLFAQ